MPTRRTQTINVRKTSTKGELREASHRPAKRLLPLVRGECLTGTNAARPCPFVTCGYHLYLDVDPRNGSIKLNYPHLEPDQMVHSCALDVVDDHEEGMTNHAVADLLAVSIERARQIETQALASIHLHPVVQTAGPPQK